jgi:hypothetical protein
MKALALASACVSGGALLACAELSGLDDYSGAACATRCADSGDDGFEGSPVPLKTGDAGTLEPSLDASDDDASDDLGRTRLDAGESPDAYTPAVGPEEDVGGALPGMQADAAPDGPSCDPGCGSPPLDAGGDQAECSASECANLCVPYFVQCCKADQSCGCALLFPRGPCI